VFQITTHTPTNVPPRLAELCAELLCKRGSEMSAMFHSIANHEPEAWVGATIAIATKTDEADNVVPIGWASLTEWDGQPSLQASVYPSFRHYGLASAMTTALTVLSHCSLAEVRVFHPRLVNAAKRAGFKDVQLWQRSDDGWVRVED
jgi:hypothetical protein